MPQEIAIDADLVGMAQAHLALLTEGWLPDGQKALLLLVVGENKIALFKDVAAKGNLMEHLYPVQQGAA